MNKAELEQKLNEALVGKEIMYNMDLIKMVKPFLNENFDNSQGYYNLRINNYTITITYKSMRVVDFKVAKVKVGSRYAVKGVSVEEDFIDIESEIKKIHDTFSEWANEDWRYGFSKTDNYEKLSKYFKALKKVDPSVKMSDLQVIIWSLHHHFWTLEDTTND